MRSEDSEFGEERRRSSSPQPHIDADIQVELTELIFTHLIAPLILSGIGLAGTCFLLFWHYNDGNLLACFWVMLLLSLARISVVVAFRWRQRPELTPAVARAWQSLYGRVTLLYCSSLAYATWYNFQYHDSAARNCCMIGVCGLCTGISARIGMKVWVAQLAGLIMLSSLGIQVLRLNEPLAKAEFVLICFFFYAYCTTLLKGYATVRDQLRTRNVLRGLAERDALTGLANRRYFHQRLSTMCLQDLPFAVLFIDLDRFKQVNDAHGHAVGDKLLAQVAERLIGTVRKQDLVARLGGDEFVIMEAPVSTAASAEALARRVNAELAAPFFIDGDEMRIGASVGIRMSISGEMDCDSLLDRADAALYLVKAAGGGGFRFAER